MWLIRIALRRPYTFIVMAMLLALGGAYSVKKTPTDIFPTIDIPVKPVPIFAERRDLELG